MKSNLEDRYEILSRAQLQKVDEEKDKLRISFDVIDYNGAFVFIYNDGTGMLFPPASGGDEGLFFNSIGAMEAMIKSRVYPVKGTNSFWEREQERVLHFDKAIPYYCSKLSEILNYEVELRDESPYLKELSKAITARLKEKKASEDSYYTLAIYFGELLRLRSKAEWKLSPHLAFNVYYTPEIVKDNKHCPFWEFLFKEIDLIKRTPLDLEQQLLDILDDFYPTKKIFIDLI